MIVIDASVVLKWLFAEEPDRPKAIELRERHLSGQNTLTAPDLLPYEVTNVLALKASLAQKEMTAGLLQIFAYEIDLHTPGPDDHVQIAHLVRQHRISAYDAAYVQLAQKVGCPLITADEKLCNKLQGLSFIHLLKNLGAIV